MTILLLGADETKAAAYRRAAENLAADETRGPLGREALREFAAEGAVAVVLDPLDEDWLEALVQAGARIVYDPPFFDAAARMRRLGAGAARRNLWLMPVLPLRLLPVVQRVQAQVAAGELGQPLYLKATFNERGRAGGAGSSALAKRGCHAFDLARWLLGSEVADAYVARGSVSDAGEDIAILSLALQNGTYATADVSWSLPRAYPQGASITIEIAGTAGSIRSDVLNQRATLYTAGATRSLNWGSDWHVEALRLALAASRDEAPPFTLEDLSWAQAQVEALN